jgi:arabinofuranosyltransferase
MNARPMGRLGRLRPRGAPSGRAALESVFGAPGLVVASGLGAIVWLLAESRQVEGQIDDAYIFYRYARNLAEGQGFVFNPGEAVEGVTSLLWVSILTLAALGGFDLPTSAHVLGLVLAAGTLGLSTFYAATHLAEGDRRYAALAPWLVAAPTSFALWASSGLETPLFAFLVVAVLLAEARGRPGAALGLGMLATLARPEGVLLVGLLLVVALGKDRSSLRRVGLRALAFAALLALVTAWRLQTFGVPLPNTYYAKVGAVVWWWGPLYVARFVVQAALPTLWAVGFALRDRTMTLGLAWLVATLLYVLAVGGDVFDHGRFFVPTLPVLAALVVRGMVAGYRQGAFGGLSAMSRVVTVLLWFVLGPLVGLAAAMLGAALVRARRLGGPARWALPALVAALTASFLALTTSRGMHRASTFQLFLTFDAPDRVILSADRWTELAESRRLWLFFERGALALSERVTARVDEGDLIACLGIGVLGFHTEVRVLDLLGLVDPTIAQTPAEASGSLTAPGHQRTNAAYVLSRRPALILIPKDGSEMRPLPAVEALWESPRFRREYEWDPTLPGYQRVAP